MHHTIKEKNKKLAFSRIVKEFNKYKYYYLLMLPGLLYFLIFRYIPMGGIIMAFKNYRFADGIWGSPWVGMKWFSNLFFQSDFPKVLMNTVSISFLKIVFNFPAPIILALLLNEVTNSVFKKTIQTVVYLPHFITWVVISGILVSLLSSSSGLLNLLGIHTSPLVNPNTFRWLLVISDMWKEIGWGTVIYLAAITGISMDMYEAARVDGANRFQQMLFITLPAIKSTIAVLLILRTGTILSAGFDQVFMLYSPIVYNVGDIIDTYVYRVGISLGNFSLATAAGLFQSLVGLIMVLFTNFVTKKMGEDGLF